MEQGATEMLLDLKLLKNPDPLTKAQPEKLVKYLAKNLR